MFPKQATLWLIFLRDQIQQMLQQC